MTIQESFARWKQTATEDTDLIAELNAVDGNESEIYERFFQELSFGTGGLRGIIGAGDNRMNIYTVRKATQGLADYLNAQYETASVAISFDSRIKSDVFAREAARTLAANGIRAHLFTELQPTPVLSYAVRELHCQAGIMVTASHNPAKYNGYKCYGADGCQMTDHDANAVTACIRRLDVFDDVHVMPYEEAVQQELISEISLSLVDRFLDEVATRQVNPGICQKAPIGVMYTPLNGTGNKPVRRILSRIGIDHVTVVPEQELPDGNFPTAPFPNPEIREAFACALKLAEKTHPDLLVATDPDCDRMGIAVKNGDEYTLMSGNEVGCLLSYYILSCRKANGTLPTNPVVVKTIVTTELAARIAESFGCEVRNVLTGFKYIGEQIGLLEKEGHPERYVLGFEESYGYLSGAYVRDKDGVVAAMLVCEMAAYYLAQGKTLLQVMAELYDTFGYYRNALVNAVFEGSQGMATMDKLMTGLRQGPPAEIGGKKVLRVADYGESVLTDCVTGAQTAITLPKSNVLSYTLEGGCGVIVRPSGTEPKIKAYVTAVGKTLAEADKQKDVLEAAATAMLKA